MNKKMINGIAIIGIAILASLSVTSCWLLLPISMIENAQREREQAREEQERERQRQERAQAKRNMLSGIGIEFIEIPLADLERNIQSISEDGHGFIVDAYVSFPDWMYIIIGDSSRPISRNGIRIGTADNLDANIRQQLERDRMYKVYIAVLKVDHYGSDSEEYNGIVTKIEGLRSAQEVEATRQAAAEEQRRAQEEANRYDPSKFTLVPSDFKPADYTARDLFNVVAYAQSLPLEYTFESSLMGIVVMSPQLYVSNVVFVRQDGTDIRFRTDDNAITQNMRINVRSGITSGQRVRLYYMLTKKAYLRAEFEVIAIERL